MSEWQVLDLSGDPTPGDPSRSRELATRMLHEAELAEDNTSRLRSVAASGGDLCMQGDYAPKFREVLGGLPDELAKLGKAYRRCGQALSEFAVGLEHAKSQSGTALRQGQDAHGRYQGAVREINAVLPPDRAARVSPVLGSNESLVEAAIADLDEGTKAQARSVARRARFAEQDRQRARRLATDAARLRGDAEKKCVDGVHDALNDSGIKNKSWWEKAWDTVSAPFRSWDAFVDLCGKIAMVAGIVALFISGPIGLALVAIALVAGAVVMAGTLSKFVQGKAGLGDLAFAALGLIPGARGVIGLARLGRAAGALAQGVRVGGRAAVGALRNLRGTLPAIRNGITSVRQSAVAMARRIFRADPVDVATGEMAQQQIDVELPGALPLILSRTHLSSYRVGRWFGPSWASTLDQRLEVDARGICYAAEDGMLLVYPLPIGGVPVLPEEGPRLPLSPTADGGYTITHPETGHILHFAPTSGDVPALPLTAISDRNGHRVDLGYDPEGMLTEIRHSGGYRIGVETTDGLITALRLLNGDDGTDATLVRYRYDTARRLTEVINSSNLPLRFDYDVEARITRWQDRNGSWYGYTYDDAGRCVRTTGSAGCLNGSFAYDQDNAITEVTDSLGHVTMFHLNEEWQIVREVNPLGHPTVSEWDRYDRLLARTDPLGRITRYTYDEAGNLVALIRPDGSQVLAEYNALRLPVVVTEPDGAVWQRQYDQQGNLTVVTDPAGATTHYAYDERGRLVTVTDALGHVCHIDTDLAGLPVAVTDPLGAVTRYERDAFGRVIAVTDPVGGITHFGWTIEGRPAWRTRPDGATERWTYDGEGNLVEHLDALGQTTRTEISHFDLPAAQITPDGARLEFSYDTELRLVSVTNPQGLLWRYGYDQAGNLISETDFNGRVLAYTYDAAEQLIIRANGAGQTLHLLRDLLGNIIERHSGDAVTTFCYDSAGRLLAATNADAELTFVRDPLGRVLAQTCNGQTLTCGYDPLGRRVSRRTPGGAESTWEYDPNHQPVVLHTAGRNLHFGYDSASREIERHLGAGAVLAQTWDVNHRLVSQTLTAGGSDLGQPTPEREARLVQQRSYRYRRDGYLTGIDDHLIGARRFDLDPIGRVTAVSGVGWTERYAYDLAGNITDADWSAFWQAGPPDGDARGGREYVGTLIRRAGNISYQHDHQGRVVMRQQKRLSAKPLTWHYTWDADDRLIAVTTPDKQCWKYCYDPLGRRIAKKCFADDKASIAEQFEFIWDGSVLAEQIYTSGPDDPGRSTVWEWEPNTFFPVSQTERVPRQGGSPGLGDASQNMREAPQEWVDQKFYTIIADLIGTPTELVDPDGTVTWRSRTTLWGSALSALSGDVDCPLRFPGQYFDPETRFSYNYHRYYDPATARYGSNDPLGLGGNANPHAYVVNPTFWIDPLGLRACSVQLGRNLETAGHVRPPNSAAHHIVAGEARMAASARATLKKFDIDINAAENGVFLPKNIQVPNPSGAAVHSTLHTRTPGGYYDSVNELLGQATTRSEAVDALSHIRDQLLRGGFP